MKKFLSLLVTFIIACSTFLNSANTSFADNEELSIPAEAGVLMDYETGRVLYSKNADNKIYPASTTKAWTAYLVLKYKPNLSEKVTIEKDPNVDGSSMYLKIGETFTVRELLEGLLIHSSNDVAVVLAEYVSGSIEEFAKLMNEEANSIGAKNTHFNNPHGLPDENHYTTAYDMALMAREAMSNSIFREIVKMKSVSFPATEAYPFERYFVNTNKFLTSDEKITYNGKEIPIKYDIVDGIKTGYTDDAGRCLLSSGVKNGMRLISAVFKSTGDDMYVASRTLLDYGFDNYTNRTIITKDKYTGSERILFSKQKELIYEPEYNYKVLLKKGTSTSSYTTKVKLNKISLPIKKGDKVGTLEVYNSKKLETTINLVATSNVNSVFGSLVENKVIFTSILVVISIIIIIFIGLIIKRKKRKKYYKKRIFKNRRR
ncbi:D-alanyl-D-alanine carboxypeptidase family protein [Romboutsia sp. 1001713B170207_170306_H8]|uniref:D-alanyl-D-alanine carboxypeptidase family protein n=1 Tax=Romboutsia sp. 1001713B170207_170306_H8 TaxID=2787112 RepID=UPI0008220545|nr:D-alanyl-D-alanine carboxypeptidase family protein [Romboutsia sp. 1001713B170207_170306_H8]SCH36216.1 D-alanyl-D-alanine carboxypeptidase dacC precursor [uncultured Clostridium sp.]